MSKGLRNLPKPEQLKAIARRLANGTGGLGYLAAVDAKRAIAKAEQANANKG